MSDIYAKNESQERENQADIHDISIDVENEAENREGHDHKIVKKDEDTL